MIDMELHPDVLKEVIEKRRRVGLETRSIELFDGRIVVKEHVDSYNETYYSPISGERLGLGCWIGTRSID